MVEYTEEEVRKASLEYFKGDELATNVYMSKYALQNNGKFYEKDLNDTKVRFIKEMLKIDSKYENPVSEKEYSKLLDHFLPGGRIIYALGNKFDKTATLSNCYVNQINDDSIEGIFDSAKRQARIFSKGGGVGVDISILRPKGSSVDNSAKETTGAVSFMDLFSNVTGLIGQHGRRGALMISIDVNHPDVIEFIKVKGGKDKTKVQFANISVKITDKFMNAVDNDEEWTMKFVLKDGSHFVRREKAKTIWNLLVESNWEGAEPGILFWDEITNNISSIFNETKPICTNPCGEIPLENGGACNLGSINLSSLVDNPFINDLEEIDNSGYSIPHSSFNWDKFNKVIKLGIRFLDNVNVINHERQPLEENKIALELGNRIGLGITGLADMLIKLNLRYDSQEAIDFIDTLYYKFKEQSLITSIELAKDRGSCGIIDKYKETTELESLYNHEYFNQLSYYHKEMLKNYGIRHIGISTVAPTGSLSILLRCSSGIEPIFRLGYERTVKQTGKDGDQKFTIYHPLVEEYNNIYGKDAHLKNDNFTTSDKIDWNNRIKLQSTIQKYITESISSTINLPNDATKEEISNIYMEAWKYKLKGITIYRDGCREGVLNESKKQHKILDIAKFPSEQAAKMKVIKSEGRKWYIHYSIDEETKLPNSLFVNTNSKETNILTDNIIEHLEELAEKHIKNGHLAKLKEKHNSQANVTKIARTLSLLLRHRVPIIDIVKSIEKIEIPVYSFVYQIKKLLCEYIEGEYTGNKCTECDSMLVYQEGCVMCPSCGYSKCG